MRIFERLMTGLALARRSIRLLRDNTELLVFPLVGGIAGLAYVGVLLASAFGFGGGFPEGPTTYVYLFALYFGSTFLAAYFTAGLMYCTRMAMTGSDPRIGDGLRAASRNLGPIVAWATISAVVGVLIRMLEDSNELAAQLVAVVFSLGWTVATYFVVPVIVFEDVGIRGMFSRSAETVRETWGESLGAEAGVGLVTVVLILAGALVGVVLLAIVGTGIGSVLGLAIIGGSVLIGALIGEALTGIAKTALYVYATEDEPPRYFEDMDFGGGGDQETVTSSGPRFGGI
jgi:hypothetical protein